jgi:hypothetical protein
MAPLVDPTVEGKPLDVQARRTMVTQKALASIDAVGQQVDNLYKVGALTKDNAKVALSGTVNELTQFATLQANGATKGIDFATLDTESKRNLVSNIQGQRAALQAQLVEATKGALDSADIDKMIAPALAQYDAAIDRITKGTEWEKSDAENQQQIAQIVAENNLLQSTVKLGETNIKVEDMATLSRVFKHAPGAVEASLGAAAGILFNSLKKNGGWTTLGGSQEDQGATARTVFQGIQNNLMNDNLSMEDTGKGGKTRLSEYDTTLKGLTREFVTDPDNVDVAVKDEALSLFADPAFLRYTTAGADAEALANSAAATGDYLRNEILPSLSDRLLSHVQMPILEKEKEAASLGFLDRLTMSPDELYAVRFRDENIPTNALINLIEMPEDVDGVNTIFRLKPEYANNPVAIREVSKLNRVYGKELNKIARAQAHINGGTDYAKGLNDVFANIGMSLPEKDLSLDLPEGGTTRTTSGGLEVTTFKDVDKDQVLATEDADNLAALEAELAQEQATFDAELDADLAALQKEIKGEEAQAAFNAFTDKIKGRLLDTSTGRAGREKSAPQTHEGDIPTAVPEKEHKASTFLLQDEGYSERLTANVPTSGSGLTVGGLDLSTDAEYKLDILEQAGVSPEWVAGARAASGAKGEEAQRVLDEIGAPPMSNAQIAEVQDRFVEDFVRPWYVRRIGEEAYQKIPAVVRAAYEALGFLNRGKNTAKAMKKGAETGDWSDALHELENYWEDGSAHNKERSDRVARLLRENI